MDKMDKKTDKKADKKNNRFYVLALGRSKRLDFTIFKGRVYVHCNDFQRQKNITFSVEELAQFFEMRNKIERYVKKLQLRIKDAGTDESEGGEDGNLVMKQKKMKKKSSSKGVKLERMIISSDEDSSD